MKLWKLDTENWTVREVEGEPWPGRDADGDVCYENSHFRTEAEAWRALERSAEARCELATSRLERAQQELAAAQLELETSKHTVARLEHLRPNEAGCPHPMEHRRPGPRIPLRYGTSATEVCADCGAWRTTAHTPGPWQGYPVEEAATAFDEL